uniref:Murine leukemia virus integrase C-terminal domain-containing protein n=1 Tax=Acanthochromis polyacanthus TaxID=80966 RepID=A0A3Q1EE29_9TELE
MNIHPSTILESCLQPQRYQDQPGDKVFMKVFRRKWFNERREGPFEVVHSTGTAVQVKGSPTWYHLSHCVKAPRSQHNSRQTLMKQTFRATVPRRGLVT